MIRRDLSSAARSNYDLLVVGGGIYGAAVTLEGARRGLRTLLLERDDFGAATTWSGLRIIHGGLRYLQKLDLTRFRESVHERRLWLRDFPDLVFPLACLMPLYGDGMRRPAIFRMALSMNEWLSRGRNEGVRPDRHLPAGRLLAPREVVELFPSADPKGLRGGGCWYDAVAPDVQRLLIECLHWACACGATCLNYLRAERLLQANGRIAGVTALDALSGQRQEYRAAVVVNAAGPWCREVSANFDRDRPELFRPSLAFNVLLDREPLSDAALAVAPRKRRARFHFLLPWKGRLLAGTCHAAIPDNAPHEPPGDELVDCFLDDLNAAVPGLALQRKDVLRLHWGRLPATGPGRVETSDRAVVVDHGTQGGPEGLFSVSGVKFTTARHVAVETLQAMAARGKLRLSAPQGARPAGRAVPDVQLMQRWLSGQPDRAERILRELREEESAITCEDILLRRTDWGMDPATGRLVEQAIHALRVSPADLPITA
jgi:glycerol-3-phosphate dehydrogenase